MPRSTFSTCRRCATGCRPSPTRSSPRSHAFRPSALLAAPLAAFADAKQAFAAFDPLGEISDALDALRARVVSILGKLDLGKLLEQPIAIFADIVAALSALDVDRLLGPILDRLDAIAAQIEDGLDETFDAFKRLQRALPDQVGSTSVSASVSVGVGRRRSMPAVATHTAIMLLAKARLEDLRDVLDARIRHYPAGQKPLVIEQRLRDLAQEALDNFAAPPLAPPDVLGGAPLGSLVSKLAVMGAMGPDIPAFSNVLQPGQAWVFDSVHKGTPDSNREQVIARTVDVALEIAAQAVPRIRSEVPAGSQDLALRPDAGLRAGPPVPYGRRYRLAPVHQRYRVAPRHRGPEQADACRWRGGA